MMIELFLSLVLAHLVADFVLQTNKICKDKVEKKWRSMYHYAHAVVVFGLSWLVTLRCAGSVDCGKIHYQVQRERYCQDGVCAGWYTVEYIHRGAGRDDGDRGEIATLWPNSDKLDRVGAGASAFFCVISTVVVCHLD